MNGEVEFHAGEPTAVNIELVDELSARYAPDTVLISNDVLVIGNKGEVGGVKDVVYKPVPFRTRTFDKYPTKPPTLSV